MTFQQVPPKEGTPGPAPVAAQASTTAPAAPPPSPFGGGGLPFPMIFMFGIMAVFLFMNFRKQKKETEARKAIKKGDRVLSQSGIVGELVELDERFAKVKISPGTVVQMLASTVSPLEAETAKDPAKDLSDLKEAKAGADKK